MTAMSNTLNCRCSLTPMPLGLKLVYQVATIIYIQGLGIGFSEKTAQKQGVTGPEERHTGLGIHRLNLQLKKISRQWLETQGSSELSFSLGTLSLNQPGDRRYLIIGHDRRVVGFLTCTPTEGLWELDTMLQTLLHQSMGSVVWWALNQPSHFGPF